MEKIRRWIRKDPVLVIAGLAAAVSMIAVPPSAAYLSYIDWRVLMLLLSLMLVVAGLKASGFFDYLTDRLLLKVKNTRALSALLVGICFFGSMFITNDVALITFVPFAVLLLSRIGQEKLLIPVIVLQTVAANLGSMFTPLGNPQNLYLYSLSGMSLFKFLSVMAMPTAVSFLLLLGTLFLIPAESFVIRSEKAGGISAKKVVPWGLLFLLCLLAVLRILPDLLVLLVVAAAVLLLKPSLFQKADYALLVTFLFLFVLIGNIKAIPQVNTLLQNLVSGRELFCGILLSQGISNVPAAMLLSGFTNRYEALLLGVNLGGLGTLIASMASLISYKLYANLPFAKNGRYLLVFTAVNFLFLAILWVVTVWWGV